MSLLNVKNPTKSEILSISQTCDLNGFELSRKESLITKGLDIPMNALSISKANPKKIIQDRKSNNLGTVPLNQFLSLLSGPQVAPVVSPTPSLSRSGPSFSLGLASVDIQNYTPNTTYLYDLEIPVRGGTTRFGQYSATTDGIGNYSISFGLLGFTPINLRYPSLISVVSPTPSPSISNNVTVTPSVTNPLVPTPTPTVSVTASPSTSVTIPVTASPSTSFTIPTPTPSAT